MSEKEFRTLRGFIRGEENEEETYFAYSATLRIFGNIPDLDEISKNLGLEPTDKHRKGEKKGPRSPGLKNDMWHYKAPVPENEPLYKHIDTLWASLKPKKEYLIGLKKTLNIDIFLGYCSNHDHAGLEVPYTSLEMFNELEVPFGLSIIIA